MICWQQKLLCDKIDKAFKVSSIDFDFSRILKNERINLKVVFLGKILRGLCLLSLKREDNPGIKFFGR